MLTLFSLGQLLGCLLVPLLLVGVLGWQRRGQPPTWWSTGLGALLLAGGAGLGHLAAALAVGDAVAPPRKGWHLLIPVAGLLGAVALAPRGRGLLTALVAGGGAWWVLSPLPGLSGWERSLWSAGVASAVMAACGGTPVERHGRQGLALVIVVALGAAMAIGLTGSKDLSLYAATVAAAAAGWWVVQGQGRTDGLVATATALIGLHLITATQYSDLPRWAAVTVLVAVPVAGVASRWSRWLAWGLAVALVGAAVGPLVLEAVTATPSGY